MSAKVDPLAYGQQGEGYFRAELDGVLDATELAISARLEELSDCVPEINERRQQIDRGAAELLETFKVRPEFFDAVDRSLLFISLASQAGRTLEAMEGPDASHAEIARQLDFVANAGFILTRKYSDAYPDLVERFENEASQSRVLKGSLVEHLCGYEQPELTADLIAYIERRRLYEETQRRMGVDPETAEWPPLHVLSIGRYAMGYFDYQKAGLTASEMLSWAQGLEQRTERFVEATPQGELASRANGFAVDADDIHHVFVPMDKAEVLLAEERGVPTRDGGNIIKRRVESTLKHEYAHTVGGVIVEDEFGKSIEERRAEYYSGDGGEYYEVKRFFRQLSMLSRSRITDVFDEVAAARQQGKGRSIYVLTANGYGLDRVIEVAAAQPDAYVQFSKNSLVGDMLESLGGFDAVVRRYALEVGREKVLDNFAEIFSQIENWGVEDTKFINYQFSTIFDVLHIDVNDILPDRLRQQ